MVKIYTKETKSLKNKNVNTIIQIPTVKKGSKILTLKSKTHEYMNINEILEKIGMNNEKDFRNKIDSIKDYDDFALMVYREFSLGLSMCEQPFDISYEIEDIGNKIIEDFYGINNKVEIKQEINIIQEQVNQEKVIEGPIDFLGHFKKANGGDLPRKSSNDADIVFADKAL